MGILLDVVVVLFEDSEEEFVLAVSNRLDDEAIVARKVEEGAGFSGGA